MASTRYIFITLCLAIICMATITTASEIEMDIEDSAPTVTKSSRSIVIVSTASMKETASAMKHLNSLYGPRKNSLVQAVDGIIAEIKALKYQAPKKVKKAKKVALKAQKKTGCGAKADRTLTWPKSLSGPYPKWMKLMSGDWGKVIGPFSIQVKAKYCSLAYRIAHPDAKPVKKTAKQLKAKLRAKAKRKARKAKAKAKRKAKKAKKAKKARKAAKKAKRAAKKARKALKKILKKKAKKIAKKKAKNTGCTYVWPYALTGTFPRWLRMRDGAYAKATNAFTVVRKSKYQSKDFRTAHKTHQVKHLPPSCTFNSNNKPKKGDHKNNNNKNKNKSKKSKYAGRKINTDITKAHRVAIHQCFGKNIGKDMISYVNNARAKVYRRRIREARSNGGDIAVKAEKKAFWRSYEHDRKVREPKHISRSGDLFTKEDRQRNRSYCKALLKTNFQYSWRALWAMFQNRKRQLKETSKAAVHRQQAKRNSHRGKRHADGHHKQHKYRHGTPVYIVDDPSKITKIEHARLSSIHNEFDVSAHLPIKQTLLDDGRTLAAHTRKQLYQVNKKWRQDRVIKSIKRKENKSL